MSSADGLDCARYTSEDGISKRWSYFKTVLKGVLVVELLTSSQIKKKLFCSFRTAALRTYIEKQQVNKAMPYKTIMFAIIYKYRQKQERSDKFKPSKERKEYSQELGKP